MKVVVDASIALAWCFEDEVTERSERALAALQTTPVIVPGLWRYEIVNGLISAVRRGRLSQKEADEALALISALPIEVDDVIIAESILAMASRTGLTAYDAAYLETAVRQGAALATNDRDLEKAARKEGVALF